MAKYVIELEMKPEATTADFFRALEATITKIKRDFTGREDELANDIGNMTFEWESE